MSVLVESKQICCVLTEHVFMLGCILQSGGTRRNRKSRPSEDSLHKISPNTVSYSFLGSSFLRGLRHMTRSISVIIINQPKFLTFLKIFYSEYGNSALLPRAYQLHKNTLSGTKLYFCFPQSALKESQGQTSSFYSLISFVDKLNATNMLGIKSKRSSLGEDSEQKQFIS